jgi:hypothetical protein
VTFKPSRRPPARLTSSPSDLRSDDGLLSEPPIGDGRFPRTLVGKESTVTIPTVAAKAGRSVSVVGRTIASVTSHILADC